MTLLLFAGGWWYWLTHRPAPPEVAGETLFRGIVYQREVRQSPRSLVIHTVKIDLRTSGLRFLATPPDFPDKELPLRARTVRQFLEESGAQLAINADFFYPFSSNSPWSYYPHPGDPVSTQGYAASNGVSYGSNGKRWVLPSLAIERDNRARIAIIGKDEPPPFTAVGGYPFLLQNGKVTENAENDEELHPRTAAALDRDARWLILLLVDGRQPRYSEGVTMKELADMLREKGGWNALNFDGGGSVTLAVKTPSGKIDVLNSPINSRNFPGTERPVANHLAVFAPPTAK